jgi:dihydrofolate reductase
MTVALIAAIADNGIIGASGRLPWRLPSDLRHFRQLTTGQTVVMGRRTFEEIGRPLPERRTIVVTRRPIDGVETAGSVEEAIARATTDVFLAGGAAVYRCALARAELAHVTRVHATPAGDVVFPDPSLAGFRLVERVKGMRTTRDEHPFTFETWRRQFHAA